MRRRSAAGPGTRHVADAKTMGRLEQSTLETTVQTKRGVKACAPQGIVKVAIDGGCHSRWKRSTHVIALYEASRLDEIREAQAHPVLERRHPGHGGQLQSHEVAEMDGGEASQEPCQGLRVAQMKGVEQRVGCSGSVHRQNLTAMLGFARAISLHVVA